ncbi:MAG: hypothetical protein M0P64_00380 [Candidatus Pacebacteria bacterium]|jgi:hypothetical protein|nr:hypothetical protein [Candidatus Paceibacterota bacterium]
MEHFNGGTIVLFLLFIVAVFGIVFFVRNKDRIPRPDNSPLLKVKREWCKAWDGTVEKQQAEKEWDELGATEINKATTLSELCSTCERVFWYSYRGKYKKRESKILLKVYEIRKKSSKINSARRTLGERKNSAKTEIIVTLLTRRNSKKGNRLTMSLASQSL